MQIYNLKNKLEYLDEVAKLSSPFHKRVWDIPNYQEPFVYTKGNLAKNISFILVLFSLNQYKKKSDIFICH